MLSFIEIRNLFIRFLKENNVYYQFISFYCDYSNKSIIDYLNKIDDYQGDYIDSSFDWDLYSSINGDNPDWFILDSKWRELYERIMLPHEINNQIL